MSDDLIPGNVREFIVNNIDSIAELEALLLLYGEPQGNWTISTIAKRLYTNQEQIQEVMAKLHLLELTSVSHESPTTYNYQPSSADLDTLVNNVADTYSKYLIPVTNLIHSKPQLKVQQFADAFKLKRRHK